jgi:hypothetical protein
MKKNPYIDNTPYQNEYNVHNDIRSHIFSHHFNLSDTVNFLPYDELWKRNWNDSFEYEVRQLGNLPNMDFIFHTMRCRLVMGVMRYGEHNERYHHRRLNNEYQPTNDYHLLEARDKKMELFYYTDNHEFIIDACNYTLLMYVYHGDNIYPFKDQLIMDCHQLIKIFNKKKFIPTDRKDSNHHS